MAIEIKEIEWRGSDAFCAGYLIGGFDKTMKTNSRGEYVNDYRAYFMTRNTYDYEPTQFKARAWVETEFRNFLKSISA
jgi:hypothetical protein